MYPQRLHRYGPVGWSGPGYYFLTWMAGVFGEWGPPIHVYRVAPRHGEYTRLCLPNDLVRRACIAIDKRRGLYP